MTGHVWLRRGGRVGAVLAAAVTLLLGVAEPSLAASGSMDGSNSQGYGKVTWSSASYLTVNVSAKDTSCNGKGFAVSVDIYMDGYDGSINDWGETREGCNTNGGHIESHTASELHGKRSGYMEMRLCHKVVVGWSCGGVVNSVYWNI
jgi:hypothetical protein